ncbi:MAG: right-handed parallel beta-helix repeat-containing protein [Candidatus Lokiarchaeota archaeon]|nr:right-handed parallel beta-helix repeat-containing protein [Candidatus Lokiarchaeota archaeon]
MKLIKKKKTLSLLFILLMVLSFSSIIFNNDTTENKTEINEIIQTSDVINPIFIDGNGDLATHPNVTGNGLIGDPYIIENFSFVGSGEDSAILIRDIDRPLIIRNCLIKGYNYGIYLQSTANIELFNNTIVDNYRGLFLSYADDTIIKGNNISYNNNRGIYLSNSDSIILTNNTFSYNKECGIMGYESDDCSIINNTILYCEYGIDIRYSSNEIIKDNKILHNSIYAILIEESTYCVLYNNTMESSGIGIGDYLGELLTIDIDISNTINGRPLYYYKNQIGLTNTNFTNPGQIILANCSNSNLSELNISKTSLAITLLFSDNNTIINNNVSNNSVCGIYLYHSNNNTIKDNTASNCEVGIGLMWFSENNTITENTALNNRDKGLSVTYSDYNSFINNTACYNSEYGIYSYWSDNSRILGNNLSSNSEYGLSLDNSNNCTIKDNMILYNYRFCIYIVGSDQCTLSNNIMNSSGIGIYGLLRDIITHEIDTSNTINDKPVYYIKNQNGLTNSDFSNAGQIILVNCSDSEISEMNISGSSGALSLMYSNNITVKNNNFSYNSFYGILLYTSSNSTIESNNVSNNSHWGIGINLRSDDNTVIDNNALNNGETGINIDTSDNNMIKNNTASYNKKMGINIDCSYYNIITDNIITNNNETGIYLHFYSEYNTIYNNRFIDNNVNAKEAQVPDKNYWDNGTIGNYWSDYRGIDLNNDGIGDLPYNIAGYTISIYSHSQDLYPICNSGINITIVYPSNIIEIGSNMPSFIVEDIDSWIDTMWYSLNGGDNTTFTSDFTCNPIEWKAIQDGIVTVTFYVNNTEGTIFSADISIVKYTFPIIISPNNNEEFDHEAPSFSIDIPDPNLDIMWYSLNGGRSITFTSNGTIDQAEWDSLLDGIIIITFYANDTNGNIASNNITIIKSTNPIIKIISPISNEEFGFEAPSFTVEIYHPQLDSMWYSLNGGDNITFTSNGTIDQVEWESLPDGIITISFYANSTLDKIASETIVITKTTPEEDNIPSYPVLIIVSISMITMIILVVKLQKKNKFKLLI